jgi:NAD(P)-dependent dehydrogenase (short-subunit alcohol dehydrogenase family)
MPEPTKFHGRLASRVALVTGAGAEGQEIGIGRAIALQLAGEGAMVACIDLDLDRAEETARLIGSRGGQALALAGDVATMENCDRFVAAAQEAFGGIDIVVNNAGIAAPTSLEAMDMALWHKILDVNLTAAMLMCRAAVPAMAQRGGGSIVNITSLAGIRTMGSLAYGASKAALSQLSRELALMHGRQGIRVNAVAPGHLATPMAMRLLPPEMREKRRKVGPLGIEGDAWDVARAVLFLASDDARFVTGTELPVDGGVSMIAPLAGDALLSD